MLNICQQFQNVLIVESRQWWDSLADSYSPAADLVLTFDLGLQRHITAMHGTALYLDNLVDIDQMQRNNFLTYRFFREWHLNSEGEDLFKYREIPFGFSFRIEIWNDLLSYVLIRANLEQVKELCYQKLVVACSFSLVVEILEELGMEYSVPVRQSPKQSTAYYFPIHRWMDEKVRRRTLKHVLARWLACGMGVVWSWVDRFAALFGNESKLIYLQVYHPTRSIFHILSADQRIRLVLGHFSPTVDISRYFKERIVPIFGRKSRYLDEAEIQICQFRERRAARLVLTNGSDITESVYSVIEKRLQTRMAEYLRDLDCIVDYIDKHPIDLEVMIANIGRIDTLVDCVCKAKNIPSYLIINGLLGPEFLDESKYATVINGYSETIKRDYFRNMGNVVVLGDPRMDAYAKCATKRSVDTNNPVITIGASGYNNIDLNSYVAIEFEFLWDVLAAIKQAKESGLGCSVIIKVRPNGYRHQYEAFVREYFPGLVNQIYDADPIRDIFKDTDLYVSIYSQTLFEASCMGIPAIFYKKDKEILPSPFDGKSELVTACSQEELLTALSDFSRADPRFQSFLNRSVMEKYIGPLDGGNLDRNMEYIYNLISMRR
jgi:hypothetical protein